jgi:hypothetical protein
MNKCAFVVPLHPKHFEYGYYIFNYLNNKNIVDLYFVFTNNNEKDEFLTKLNNDISNKVKFLLLTDFVDIKIVEKTNSFVSIKKLFALSILKEKYDYISCIDSEIKFINDTHDYYTIMKNIVNSKIICGGKLHENAYEKNIVRDSLNILTDKKYHESLQTLSYDYRIYTWWCNLPVYDCSIAGEFLEWISFNNNTLERFCWNIFDDMLYNFFCILFHNYRFKLIENCFHSLEFVDTQLVEHVDKNIYKLYWVNNNAYCQNKKYYEENNFQIVFHLDRWQNIKPILKNNNYIN